MSNFNEKNFDDSLKDKIKDISIEVPDSLKRNVLDTLENLPERNINVKRKFYKVVGIFTVVLVSFLGFNMVMPVYAEKLPIIGATFKSINLALHVGDKYAEGAKDINLSDSYDDITMTIKNIYYDGVELAIAYEIKCDSGFKKTPVIFPLIKKGFKYLHYDNELHKGEFIDEKTYVGLSSYVFNDEEFFDKGNIKLIINDIYGEWSGYYPEKLKFNLYLNSENMGKKVYKINKEFSYDESKFKILDVIISPFNTIVQSKFKINTIGNRNEKINNLSFRVIDHKGMPLELEMGQLTSNNNFFRNKNYLNSIWRFEGVDKEAKEISIIPILEINNNKTIEKSEDNLIYKVNKDNETIIKLENKEEYIIENISFNENETVVNVKVKKYLYNINSSEVYFLDENKEQIEFKDTKFNGIENGYKFTLILPKLDSEKDYYLSIPKEDNNKIILENEKIILKLDNNRK